MQYDYTSDPFFKTFSKATNLAQSLQQSIKLVDRLPPSVQRQTKRKPDQAHLDDLGNGEGDGRKKRVNLGEDRKGDGLPLVEAQGSAPEAVPSPRESDRNESFDGGHFYRAVRSSFSFHPSLTPQTSNF